MTTERTRNGHLLPTISRDLSMHISGTEISHCLSFQGGECPELRNVYKVLAVREFVPHRCRRGKAKTHIVLNLNMEATATVHRGYCA